ncbi:hypothetical protein E1267_13745 [Nonomuraea longispora]|uniref:Uncharacterized protein n=1 Tax=Nonomuraea longispora TaxID=1848320 RepID=A0A4R4NI32_9ACTN|nr:hypothetical protein [Nonomuraea longispora]TDC07270.1 hypothetical protein E1267_13745 [Nonomuraea longispora]
MSQSFVAAVQERAARARAALEAVRDDGDADQVLQAEVAWEDVQRFARRHGVPIDSPAEAPGAASQADGRA